MAPSRTVARPLLAGMFVFGGIDALRHPESKAPKAEAVAPPIAKAVGLPEDSVTLVRINGGAQLLGGALLALGKMPRLASALLAASLVPTTLAGHRFWEEEDPTKRAQQQVQFLKNMAMLGGLLLAVVDTEGRPSVTWSLSRRMPRAHGRRTATKVARQAHEVAHSAAATGRGFAATLADGATQLSKVATEGGRDLGKEAARAAARVAARAEDTAAWATSEGTLDSARSAAEHALSEIRSVLVAAG